MTVQKSHHLTQAQAYYLQALGVDLYGLKDDDESVENSAKTVQVAGDKTDDKTSEHVTESPKTASLEAIKLKLQSKSKPQTPAPKQTQPSIQNQPSIQTQTHKHHQSKTALMPEQAFKQSRMVADLCVLQGVSLDAVKKLGDDYFQLGAIEWRFIEQVNKSAEERFKFTDNKLISEPMSRLTDIETKRALWSALMSTLR